MTATYDDKNRQVMPRWLDYSTSCVLGLLHKIGKHEHVSSVMRFDPRTTEEWQSSPSLGAAVDLIGEAMILKDFESDQAREASEFVLKNARPSLQLMRQLAQHFLEDPPSRVDLSNAGMDDELSVRDRLAHLRQRSREHGMNPILWSDLSLAYANSGNVEKSRRAMLVAMGLGKGNRQILRSAARCFLHAKEPDRAVGLLRKSERCLTDPWIASAEIAISEGMGLSSRCVSKARYMTDDDNLSDYSRSELAATVSTMNLKNGSVKRAKKLLRQTLRDPTENALAQAEWLGERLQTDIVANKESTPGSFEARARHYFREREYEKCVSSAMKWGGFQPFSSRPLIAATYVAGTFLDDDRRSIQIVEDAPRLHRNDPLFANNYACALARRGRLEEAERTLRSIDPSNLSESDRLSLLATRGLIRLRAGQLDEGREYYKEAMRGFGSIREPQHVAVAAYFWASEEKRMGTELAPTFIEEAKALLHRVGLLELEDLAKKL